MIPLYTGQTDLRVAMGTPAVNVSFAVFPFVAAQKKPLLRIAAHEQIFSIFLRALGNFSGKHTVEHENANSDGEGVQCNADNIVSDEECEHRDDEIGNEESARKRIRAVPSVEKSR